MMHEFAVDIVIKFCEQFIWQMRSVKAAKINFGSHETRPKNNDCAWNIFNSQSSPCGYKFSRSLKAKKKYKFLIDADEVFFSFSAELHFVIC